MSTQRSKIINWPLAWRFQDKDTTQTCCSLIRYLWKWAMSSMFSNIFLKCFSFSFKMDACLHSEVLKYNVSTWVSISCSAQFRHWEIVIAKRRLKWWRHPVWSSGPNGALIFVYAWTIDCQQFVNRHITQGQAVPDSCLIRLQHCSSTHLWCWISLSQDTCL